MAEGSMNFSRAPGFTGSRIDRADNLRLDEARIATFLGDLKARLLRLEVLDPVLAVAGRLAWVAMTELAEGVTPLLRGRDGGRPLFAPLVRRAPGATLGSAEFGYEGGGAGRYWGAPY